MPEARDLPHFCETAEVADAMANLSRLQRRALRGYVWEVELGGKGKVEWLKEQTFFDNWYRTGKGARYEHNAAFQTALRVYLRAALRWSTVEEQAAIAKANRTMRLAADRAARRVVSLVDVAENDRVRLDASKTVLAAADIAGARVAVSMSQGDAKRLTDEELERIARGDTAGDSADQSE